MVGKHHALWRLLAVLVAFSLIAAACGGDDDDAADDGQTEATDDSGGSDDGAADDGASDDGASDDGAADDGAAADDDGGDDNAITAEIDDSDAGEAVEGGTVRVGIEADVDGLNPTGSAISAPGYMIMNAVFDTLAVYDESGNAVPYLAESFTPNEDMTSWTVKLREGVMFHDGTPLNSEALRANFEVVIADPLVGLAVAPFYPTVEEGAFEIIDDLTARYNLLDPTANWPAALTGQLGMIASPTWLAAAAEDATLNQQPVGTGPFVFDSRSEDSVTRFVRNESWWNGRALLDAVEFVPVTDPDVRTSLLLEDELTVLHTTNPASIISLVEAEGDGIRTILDDTGEESFAMINSAVPPFDDIRAREALTRATPRELYNSQIAQGVNRPATHAFTPESPFFNPNIVSVADDPDGAVALAAEYCGEFPDNCTDGKINMELQWSGPSVIQTQIAELLNEGWSVAFNVTFQELPQDAHIQETAFGVYNVVTWRQFGAVDPYFDNVWLLCRTVGGISLNWPKFCDEGRDALLLEGLASTDEARRVEIQQEVWQQITDDFLYIFFNHTLWAYGLGEGVNGVCDRLTPEGVAQRCQWNGRLFWDSVWLDAS